MSIRIAVAALILLLLAGCSAPPEQPAPSPTPQLQLSEPSGPRIGTQSAAIAPVRAPLPPTRVQVESVGIDVSVQPVGVQPDGFMELPADVSIAGWYRFGADPGSATGTTVVSAHVDSLEYGLGPFSRLKGLVAGSSIVVTTADGAAHTYVVESVQSILKSQLPLDQVFDRAGTPRLALITCGGQFDYNALNYSDNVVVFAVPVAP